MPRPLALLALSLGALAGLVLGLLPPRPAAAAVPSGFSDSLVATVGLPTALAFTPDGRLLIASQPGRLSVVEDGTLLTPAALDLHSRICPDSERGLLGVAVDPNFAGNRFIYVYYTANIPNTGCRNRVSRFSLPASNSIDLASELVLIDRILSFAGNHNGGDVQFGRDGYLYVSVGDSGCDYANDSGCAGQNDASRDQHVLIGKILRITPDGGIPPDNPFQGPGTARCNLTGQTSAGNRCQETYAWGLRNPYRIAFDPNAGGTRFFINDVGQGAWEEVNLGQAGADYGWNCREGAHTNSTTGPCSPTPPGMVDPIHEYSHAAGCASITGGAFVPSGAWPAAYAGAYLYADYVCGRIFSLKPNGSGGYDRTEFGSGLGGVVHLAFGSSGCGQALYYATYRNGGEVRRINPQSVNCPPSAALSASPRSGPLNLTVRFDGSDSSDPNPGDSLTYLWNFGDGQTAETSTPTTQHTYTQAGAVTATLRVRDGQGLTSSPASVRLYPGNTPPTPNINTPGAGARFSVGQTINLSGSADDAQEGGLPASALTWRVILHHGSHTHPFVPPTNGNNVEFVAPPPEDLAATANSYLEIELTATDSAGASAVVTRELRPRQVSLTFASDPPGLQLRVGGELFKAPRSVVSWDGYRLNVAASSQRDACGRNNTFQRWSDGGAASHAITTPAADTTYTASFQAPSACDARSIGRLDDLIENLRELDLPRRLKRSLQLKLQTARRVLGRRTPSTESACAQLARFISQVQSETGRGLTANQANQLTTSATDIRAGLGCPG